MASPAAAAAAAAAAAGCNLNNNNNHPSGVRKCGYLRKQKHGHKRFFVLRGPGPPAQPARLEYYDSEKKWRSKAAAPKRVISLDSCLNVNKRADAKHKYLIALYTRDEYFAVAADDEREQDGWYRALTDLLSEGKAGPEASSGCSSCSSSSLPSPASPAPAVEEPPAGAAYREVWQVNLKPKGLGHTKNLTGVYRLCLAARTVGLVKLNRQLPSVTLQLMSIRRCGHSDSFFFMEVGRSAATGPGELWMQADDSVVAQNIHETILEAMKALKELAEFRPRSKSQSASGSSASRPISVPGARHLVGLPRRPRPDGRPGPGPCSACRLRTASEGDGSPCSPGPPFGRSHTGGCGGPPARTAKGLLPPAAASPGSPASLSSSSSGGGQSWGPVPPRPGFPPWSCSASTAGSPSDPGFMSLDEDGEDGSAAAYVSMERGGSPAGRPRTASLDEPGRRPYPEDYGRVEIGGRPHDAGYVAMTPGVAARRADYVPMSPASVSAPQRIVRAGRRSPPEGSPEEEEEDDGGYMPMWSAARAALGPGGSPDGRRLPNGDYLHMSPSEPGPPPPPPGAAPCCCSYNSLPRSYKAPGPRPADRDQYVLMGARAGPEHPLLQPLQQQQQQQHVWPQAQQPMPPRGRPGPPAASPPGPAPWPGSRPRAVRPTRLALETPRALPDPPPPPPPPPPEPRSPGEYVNIDFGEPSGRGPPASPSPSSLPSPGSWLSWGTPGTSAEGRRRSPLLDYMNVGFGGPAGGGGGGGGGSSPDGPASPDGASPSPPPPGGDSPGPAAAGCARSPASALGRLSLRDRPDPQPAPVAPAKVVRADPQGGRRRHSSETFSATATVSPLSPPFAPRPKRHTSASVENVSLRKAAGPAPAPASHGPGLDYLAQRLKDAAKGKDVHEISRKASFPSCSKEATFSPSIPTACSASCTEKALLFDPMPSTTVTVVGGGKSHLAGQI